LLAACGPDVAVVERLSAESVRPIPCDNCLQYGPPSLGRIDDERPVLALYRSGPRDMSEVGSPSYLFLAVYSSGLVLFAPQAWEESTTVHRLQATPVELQHYLAAVDQAAAETGELQVVGVPHEQSARLVRGYGDRACCWSIPVSWTGIAWTDPEEYRRNTQSRRDAPPESGQARAHWNLYELFFTVVDASQAWRAEPPAGSELPCSGTTVGWSSVSAQRPVGR